MVKKQIKSDYIYLCQHVGSFCEDKTIHLEVMAMIAVLIVLSAVLQPPCFNYKPSRDPIQSFWHAVQSRVPCVYHYSKDALHQLHIITLLLWIYAEVSLLGLSPRAWAVVRIFLCAIGPWKVAPLWSSFALYNTIVTWDLLPIASFFFRFRVTWTKGEDHDFAVQMSVTAFPLRRAVDEYKALVEWTQMSCRGSNPSAL